MVTGKTTPRARRQPATDFSPVGAMVGDFMPPWSMARTTQAAITVQIPSPGCAGVGVQGVSLGTGANAQGAQVEFESSPNILLPFFSPGAKILPPNGQAPLLDHAGFPCELSIRRSSRTDLPQTRLLSPLLSSSSTLPISNNPSYPAPKNSSTAALCLPKSLSGEQGMEVWSSVRCPPRPVQRHHQQGYHRR